MQSGAFEIPSSVTPFACAVALSDRMRTDLANPGAVVARDESGHLSDLAGRTCWLQACGCENRVDDRSHAMRSSSRPWVGALLSSVLARMPVQPPRSGSRPSAGGKRTVAWQ